ncbi:ABC transporter substrate-binding protein [Fibrella forsythiae]|uniref:ABC transporter substrate-binding protein n=1 Tax=Fibrella forsythiae TaxID=2817061 RepID=A0ABS3JET0_9BACT|nr:helical backbone metal receptor [Fibrella forsythiae]MBO0948495.1 ABC transporter substrate-binding protein [Fibrella forsythiae]
MSVTAQPQHRIVSLVPSQTELLFALGLTDEVVGITKFCTQPAEKVADKPRVGGTKNVTVSAVAALKPTLILANYEENTEADVVALREIAPVHCTDIKTLPDALNMIREVGALVGRPAEADNLAGQIGASFATLRSVVSPEGPSVAYLIWRKPYMVAASDTFIDAMLTEAGFRNAFTAPSQSGARWVRYPVVTETDLKEANPDLVFLSSEPYPFRQKHLAELQAHCLNARVRLVDGELFSWYGSRLLHTAAYFAELRRDLI